MKSSRLIATAVVALLVSVPVAFAGEAATDATHGKAPDPAVHAPKELKHQTNCPVMGGLIDSTAYTDIQGQRVYHCCPMCTKKLKADPDKYFNEAAEAGILFENIQTTCPVSGKKLGENAIYSDYQGRRLYFADSTSIELFNKAPKKYLTMMDEPKADSTMHMNKMHMDSMHMGHGADSAKHNH
ncbi:MAG: hypothetical protein ACE5FH_00960 [Candidatus Zixiibacteriota bacterium]